MVNGWDESDGTWLATGCGGLGSGGHNGGCVSLLDVEATRKAASPICGRAPWDTPDHPLCEVRGHSRAARRPARAPIRGRGPSPAAYRLACISLSLFPAPTGPVPPIVFRNLSLRTCSVPCLCPIHPSLVCMLLDTCHPPFCCHMQAQRRSRLQGDVLVEEESVQEDGRSARGSGRRQLACGLVLWVWVWVWDYDRLVGGRDRRDSGTWMMRRILSRRKVSVASWPLLPANLREED